VFDRNKAVLYSIYQRSLRDNPGLSGHITLSIVVEPSGKVLSCAVSKSTLNHPELERQIAARIRFFDFGAKNTDRLTFFYPIDFFAE
jgi:TonB family protein